MRSPAEQRPQRGRALGEGVHRIAAQVALERQPAVEADAEGADDGGEVDVPRARLPPGAVAELDVTDEVTARRTDSAGWSSSMFMW